MKHTVRTCVVCTLSLTTTHAFVAPAYNLGGTSLSSRLQCPAGGAARDARAPTGVLSLRAKIGVRPSDELLDADGPVEVTAAGVIVPPTIVHEAAMEEPMAETELELEAAETKESEPEAQISPTLAFASLNADPEPPKKAGAPTEKEWFQFW
mmetsp:Transcript_33249/g.48559  ORF Transcript_33249/g.48559 Transcript_33249/m.48559 type:complete len:152 (+) Transcript_33249:91-546(+)